MLSSNNPNFKKYISYSFLKTDKEEFSRLQIKKISVTNTSVKPAWHNLFLLAKIRNKFSHNQFLPKEDFEKLMEIIPLKKGELIATYLNKSFIELQKMKKI